MREKIILKLFSFLRKKDNIIYHVNHRRFIIFYFFKTILIIHYNSYIITFEEFKMQDILKPRNKNKICH